MILLQIQTTKTVQYLSIDLRKDIINQIEKKRITDFQKKDTGIYASWLTNDITTIENQGFYNILQAIQIITGTAIARITIEGEILTASEVTVTREASLILSILFPLTNIL